MTFAATLHTRFDPGANNFDLIRLLAALVVVFGHAYSLAGGPVDPISTWGALGYSGTLAVGVFFVLSGFLIARSAERSTLQGYLAARALRILPALALVTVFEAFVLGPFFVDGSRAWYLWHTAPGHLHNVLVFGEDPYIAGVFARNPVPYVNGALWSLPIEALFYLLLPFVLLLAAGRRWLALALFAAAVIGERVLAWQGFGDDAPGTVVFNQVRVYPGVHMAGYYLAGVVAWLYRDRVPFDRGVALSALLLLFAARGGIVTPVLLKLCLPYAVLYAGLAGDWGTRLKARVGDWSYGVYVFHFPIIGAVVALGRQSLPGLTVFGCAVLPVLLLAALSWHLVENPALRLRRRIRVHAAEKALTNV